MLNRPVAAPCRTRSNRGLSALIVSVGLLVLGGSCGSDEPTSAPTTIDPSPLTTVASLESTSSTASVTTPPDPLSPDQEAAVAEAVRAYHDAVAASFDPLDPDHPDLAAATTATYLPTLQALIQSVIDSGRTIESDYRADIVSIQPIGADLTRADLCEVDRTVIVEADGSSPDAPSSEPAASYLVLRLDDNRWLVDGGGSDADRSC